MKKILLNRQHLMDYTLYGILSGIFFSIAVWFYLYDPGFRQLETVHVGSGLFMFVITLYLLKLAGDESVRKGKTREIFFSGQLATLSGILVSTGISLFLCFAYKPEVFTVSPAIASQVRSLSSVFDVFIPAIFLNFLAGSFVSLILSYTTRWSVRMKGKSVSL